MNSFQMHAEERSEDKLEALSSTVGRLIDGHRLGDALTAIQSFVEEVIFDPSSTAVVFVSPQLDALCKAVASAKARSSPAYASGDRAGTVFLVSELSRAGGHNELIKDIVRLALFPQPLCIVQTDCFERLDVEVSDAFAAETGVAVRRAGGEGADEKLSWLVEFLRDARPEKLLLLAHNQDALAVTAAFTDLASPAPGEVVYIHHGDHHLSLGAATPDFIHVDPHNMGYFHCRDELGNRCNHYWPMTVGVPEDLHREPPFIAAGHLVTCSSGRAEKFEAGSYAYDYFKLLPDILRTTGGTHVHIGDLQPARLGQIGQALAGAGIDQARFVHLPWVPSVARALIDQKIDLYISSFPLGGGKATLEAMAAGIPLLMHQSYRSRFLGGVDIAYAGAFVWHDAQELFEVLACIDSDMLANHSTRARSHYRKFHSDDALVAASRFDAPQDESLIPPLTKFEGDALAAFLDQQRARAVEDEARRSEIEKQADELRLYEAQAQEFQEQLTRMTSKAMELEGEVERARVASSARTESSLREIEAERQHIAGYRNELSSLLSAIERDRSQIGASRDEIGALLKTIESERQQVVSQRSELSGLLKDIERERSEVGASREEIGALLRSIESERRLIIDHRHELADLLRGIERDRNEIGASREQIGAHLRSIDSERHASKQVNEVLRKNLDELAADCRKASRILEEIKHERQRAVRTYETLEHASREFAKARKLSIDADSARLSNEQAVAALMTEVQQLRSSTSWRITKPLRLVSRMVKKEAANVESKTFDFPAVASAIDSAAAFAPELPRDFDGDVYLKLNPDLQAAGVDAAAHYVSHGRHENRSYALPDFSVADGGRFDTELADVVPLPFDFDVASAPELPRDFDGDVYLKLNPDLRAAGVDAAEHYVSHGRHENRRYALPDFSVTRSERFDAALRTVLLVGHEASRTGAPILTLNLAQVLARKYNVVVLLLGGGALTPAFEVTGATVMTASAVRGSPFVAHYVVSQICEQFDFEFALVNSIESRPVLPVLAEFFVPTISLIHEFASYTRPKEAFQDALRWSSEVVFSANVTKENAFSTFPELAEASATVLPQGKCILPASSQDPETEHTEVVRLQDLIRPKDLPEDTLVVLGAGFVQLRKGVDLFIECASRVMSRAGDRRFRFVWIGHGYDPDNDIGYSVYLHDQIRRAGLTENVFFLGETSAIESAYEMADLFLLSSRLDPLPNVAIDAMTQGVPVLCFDRTTGIADFLLEVGLGPKCVAPYLDSNDIASKILGFADARESIPEVGAQCRSRAGEYFNMTNYVEQIEELADKVRSRVKQEAVDCRTILEAGVLRPDFADQSPDVPPHEMVRRYVRTWASGIGRRKPFPGFHPGIYLEQHGVAVPGGDPLADYLRAGRPQGSWNYEVITPDRPCATPQIEMRIALHIHAYYVDMLPDILGRLAANLQHVDLFISVTSDAAHTAALAHAQQHRGHVASIRTVPNRGRDIGPFFTEFFDAMKVYDIVGHVHTKKSVDLTDGNVGRRWFSFLAANLIGDEAQGMLDVIVDSFNRDPSIGMVFPDDPYISGMETNRKFAESMSARLGIGQIPEYFIYPVGTMFWARPAALMQIAGLNLQWDDYPPEPLPYDGSMLHAMERLIALSVPATSWKIATTNMNGVTR